MKRGSIEHIEQEIAEAEEHLFCLAERLNEMVDATSVVLRVMPLEADRMLATLRTERSVIRREMNIYAGGLERYDALRIDALRDGG